MYDGEYRPNPREDPSPSNLRTQAQVMNATGTPTRNDLSASGPGPSTSGVQLASDGTHFGFSQLTGIQHPLAPLIQGTLQQTLLQGNPSGVQIYGGGPNNNATATPSSCPGGGNVPAVMPYSGLPMALPNIPSGQTSNSSPTFQVAGQPPTMAWLHEPRPEVYARPNEQGIPGPLWQLIYADLDYQGGDDLRVVIHFRKTRPS